MSAAANLGKKIHNQSIDPFIYLHIKDRRKHKKEKRQDKNMGNLLYKLLTNYKGLPSIACIHVHDIPHARPFYRKTLQINI